MHDAWLLQLDELILDYELLDNPGDALTELRSVLAAMVERVDESILQHAGKGGDY